MRSSSPEFGRPLPPPRWRGWLRRSDNALVALAHLCEPIALAALVVTGAVLPYLEGPWAPVPAARALHHAAGLVLLLVLTYRVLSLGAAAVRGYQGERLGGSPRSVIACAKHYAGDGATEFKSAKSALLDQGDTRLSPEDFRRIAIAPYLPAIAAGVGSIMVSFSSVHGKKMHGHRELLTDVLKGELGFRGFVVTDWTGIEQLHGTNGRAAR